MNDARALHRVLGDPLATRYYDLCRPLSLGEVANQVGHWECHQRRYGFAPRLLLEKRSRQIAGLGGLAYYPETMHLGPELFYILHRSLWGRGLATEFARSALSFGFGELRAVRIVATVRHENVASSAVLRKVGMSRRGALPELDRELYCQERARWANTR